MAKKKPPATVMGGKLPGQFALKGRLLGVGGGIQTNPGQTYDPFSYGNFVEPNVPVSPLTKPPGDIPGWVPPPVEQVNVNLPDTAQTSATGQTTSTFAPRTRKVAAHWFKPDWEGLLQGDPRFIAGQSALTAAKGSAGTKRANAIKNAIIAFGARPRDPRTGQEWTGTYGDLTEADLAKAQENPYSFMALAQAQRGRGSADLAAALAGRGMLNSGALVGGENQVLNTFNQGVAGQSRSLLDILGGAEGDYGTGVAGLDTDWINTQATIAQGIQQTNPAQWIDEYEETY